MTKIEAPYGTWASDIGADMVAGQSLRFGLVQALGDRLLWTEVRPAEGGRGVVVERGANGALHDLVPAPYSARSRVHEYGGGEFLAHDSGVWFVNDKDQDIYRANADGVPERVTQESSMRFADMTFDETRGCLVAVAERHGEGHAAPDNMIVSVGADGAVSVLAEGADFYAFPRLSPDGARLCWMEWMLPAMPWEASRLMVADVRDDGTLSPTSAVAGGGDSAVFQPEWAADGSLVFVWDKTGWGNPYRFDDGEVTALAGLEAEFGRPLWGLGTRSYALMPDGSMLASVIEDGIFRLARVALDGSGATVRDLPASQLEAVCAYGDGLAGIVAMAALAPAVVLLDAGEALGLEAVRPSLALPIDRGLISEAELLTVPVADGEPVHALYYPPRNDGFEAPQGTAPPVVVSAHGGPTGMADRGFKLKIQYWTSRGFGFLDVDYRGSSGYGRAYREALDGEWGVGDVRDVVEAARHLVERGLADGDKLVISGGSAGGFTVLCALAFHDIFAAGASSYGIGDLQKLCDLTHKFEAGYLYRLTGTEPGHTKQVFEARSPLFHADGITSPVIFFQGLDDKVVPPGQSRDMVESLKGRGVPCAYLEFEGEGHGFRRAETIVRALTSEYAFYARVLGLAPREPLPELSIFNDEELP